MCTNRGLCGCTGTQTEILQRIWSMCTGPIGVFVCRCAHIPAGQTLFIISVFNRKACAVSHQPRSLLWSEGCCQLLGVVLEALWAVHIKMITQACFCISRMFKPSSSVKLVFCFALPRWNPPWKSQFSNWSGSLYRASGPSVLIANGEVGIQAPVSLRVWLIFQHCRSSCRPTQPWGRREFSLRWHCWGGQNWQQPPVTLQSEALAGASKWLLGTKIPPVPGFQLRSTPKLQTLKCSLWLNFSFTAPAVV